MEWNDILLVVIAFLCFLIGFAGLIIPILPGIPVMWAGVMIVILFTGFDIVSQTAFISITVIMLVSLVVDYLASYLGTKQYGAGKWGITGSIIGLMAGLITAGLPGLIIGSFLGAMIGELAAGKTSNQALKSGVGALVGFLSGTIVKIILGLTVIIIFIMQLF